jgi:signal peptidase II
MAARLLPYAIAAVVFLADRVTKALIERHVSVWDTYTVIPGFFDIIHSENPGAAFSLFANAHSEWRTFFLVGIAAGALVLIAVLLWNPRGRLGDSRLLRAALSLILGGAAGNLYDRVVRGTVTDFLDFYIGDVHWPAFNVADSAITIGAVLVLLDVVLSRRPAEHRVEKA